MGVGTDGLKKGLRTAKSGEATGVAGGLVGEGFGLGRLSEVPKYIAAKIASPPIINARTRAEPARRNRSRFGSAGEGLCVDGVAVGVLNMTVFVEARRLAETLRFNASHNCRQFA